MSSSTKKGGTLGVGQKVDRNDASTGGGSKGDSLSTTPSKSSKTVTKKALATSTSNKGGSESVTNPAILNQQALEALYSATYVEDFIDCNDNMGDDLIRQTTRMFEMGSNYMTYIRELETAMAILLGDDDSDHIAPDQLIGDKKKAVFRLQQVLITAQDTGDDSLQVMQGMQDHIENKTRQLDVDRKNLAEYCKEQDPSESAFKDPPPPTTERSIKRARRQRHEIYRPSILGPSSLKATSYPETVSTNSRDHEPHVVTTSRSRDRDRSTDRNQSSNQSSGPTAARSQNLCRRLPSLPSQRPVKKCNQSPTVGLVKEVEVVHQEVKDQQQQRRKKHPRLQQLQNRLLAQQPRKVKGLNGAVKEVVGLVTTPPRVKSRVKDIKSKRKRRQRKEKLNKAAVIVKKTVPLNNTLLTRTNLHIAFVIRYVSYGEMIGCDNDLCPIEWYHYNCLGIVKKPKGKWYCPMCRGDRPNTMKPKAIFLKELEKYNREKEKKEENS
ncbi:Inhibitor of growth protein 1 [Orchesella cincta]|uniref:Inhibitor of growth protein 1 n=1 Tax=Orchesella cincta TaxID=48709 RepID=A0A1D2NLT3_ORCCI|nr:Inhibitor of growth protein 1 [Orchesella cincta]